MRLDELKINEEDVARKYSNRKISSSYRRTIG